MKRAFPTEHDLINRMNEYLNYCNELENFPNIAGFCVFCDITRETFYAQKNYYSDTYKKVNDILENGAINSKHASDTWKIFYAKNKFGYRDRFETSVEHNPIEVNLNLKKLSKDELKHLKQLSKKVKDE